MDFLGFLKYTQLNLTKSLALTAQRKVARHCHTSTPARELGQPCLTSTPASSGAGPHSAPHHRPAPSCRLLTRFPAELRALLGKGTPVPTSTFTPCTRPRRFTDSRSEPSSSTKCPVVPPAHLRLKGAVPRLTSQCHLSMAAYRKYFPHMKVWYFCLSCFEIHRSLNKLQETIKSEKAVNN